MRFRSLIVLSGMLLLIAAGASAGPKDEVAAATAKWGETLGQNDPDKVVALYAPDAVLWETLSPTVRSDRAALRDYFVTAFKVLPNLKVAFGEQLVRVYGTTAVNTGYYTFSYVSRMEKPRRSRHATALHSSPCWARSGSLRGCGTVPRSRPRTGSSHCPPGTAS
jgi:hypothetical protein